LREHQPSPLAESSATPYSTVNDPPISVYKVGGSLLTLTDLAARLCDFLERQSASRPLLILGGGATADIVRQWDQIHELGDESAHWLAMESLRLNEELLRTILPQAVVVENERVMAGAWRDGRLPILNAIAFIRTREPSSRHPLPHCWDVTSDSIAAWVAIEMNAAALILLKSRDCPLNIPRETEQSQSSIDRYFAQLRPKLKRVGWANLRAKYATVEWM